MTISNKKNPILYPRQIKQAFAAGKNITALVRQLQDSHLNSDDAIEIAYDLQSGRYSRAMLNDQQAQRRNSYAAAIAAEINPLLPQASLLEAGVGEATTLSGVLKTLQQIPQHIYGFDLSWSRLAYARRWLAHCALNNITLCTGTLHCIPFADNSIDIVYTSHSIEPNGGREEPILRELYRVARQWLVLIEPGYELADDQARKRMRTHGYCQNLVRTCDRLGFDVIKHDLLPNSLNPLNPSAVIVIRKVTNEPPSAHHLACPRFKTPLIHLGGALYSEEALAVYPVIGGIPCLRPESAILASHYPEFVDPPIGDRP